MEIKKLPSRTYVLYDYLKDNCTGSENAQKGFKIAKSLGYKSLKELRADIKRIRVYGGFNRVMCSNPTRGYWLAKDENDIQNSYIVKKAISEMRSAIASGVSKNVFYKALAETPGNSVADRQMKLQFGKYEKNVVEKFVRDK